MSDDLGKRLEEGLSSESTRRHADLNWVAKRGAALRRRQMAITAMTGVVVLVLGWTSAASLMNSQARRDDAPGPSTGQRGTRSPVYEEMTEQERAEVFAFRALANTGLMHPYGERSYNWTYEEDTSEVDGAWRVGFAASDCAPRGSTFTCTGLSGDDPELGNAITDTFVIVKLEEGLWRVIDVEGNMLSEEEERVVGYELPDEKEPSHWDFASVGVWDKPKAFSMTPIWVGPYPTDAPGSVCEVTGVDASGNPVGDSGIVYITPPDRPFERGGWVRGGGVEFSSEVVDAVVECEQFRGPGWEIEGQPVLVGTPGQARGVSIRLKWTGDKRFTTGTYCRATLVNESGEVVWEKEHKGSELWPLRPKRYPYRTAVFLNAREPVNAERVGRAKCRSF